MAMFQVFPSLQTMTWSALEVKCQPLDISVCVLNITMLGLVFLTTQSFQKLAAMENGLEAVSIRGFVT